MDIETRDTPLKSWWKKVISNNKSSLPKQVDEGVAYEQVFGVPLEESLKCAKAAIAYVDNDVQYVGFIPVIVAKCGSFLKDQGLYTEGVFRMSGSAKRIGQLQQTFSMGPDYGRQLDWKGYSVHDAANVLRRFLNYLPEPVIVHQLYQPFRDTILLDSITEEERVKKFQQLIEKLPEYHQYLLFYLLDLLSLFCQNAQFTRMDSFNLSSVFTPGILSSPEHVMNPAQYKTSQKVIQFLIEHQHCFKMPRSSWFTVLNQPKEESTKVEPTQPDPKPESPQISPIDPPISSTLITQRQSSQPTHYNTTSRLSHPYHTPKSETPSGTSSPVKEQRVKRAKTMPTKRSRYGPNDPLQVVQLNKSILGG